MPLCPQITNTPVDIVPTTAAITAISYTSSTATYTATAHGFSAAEVVIVSDTAPAGYNDTFTITSVTTNTFTVPNTTNTAVTTATGTAWKAPTDYEASDNSVIYAIDSSMALAQGVQTFYASTAPTTTNIGDMWFDTSNSNKQYRWSGSAWVSVQDGTIATALSTANTANSTANTALSNASTAQTAATTAQSTADGKNKVTYSGSTPSGSGTTGDIWWQFSGGVVIGQWQWSGSSWVSAPIGNAVIANIDAGKITAGIISGIELTNGSGTFRVTSGGSVTATSGAIGGFTLASTYFGGSGGFTLNSDGTIDGGSGNTIYYGKANIGGGTAGSESLIVTGASNFNGTLTGLAIVAQGDLSTPNHTTTGNAANGYVFSTGGRVTRSTASSRRYKENIVDIADVSELDPKKLLDFKVRAFSYKKSHLDNDDRAGILIPGLIAEEVDAIYPLCADYTDGEVENINDRAILINLLALVQDLYKEINLLKGETP